MTVLIQTPFQNKNDFTVQKIIIEKHKKRIKMLVQQQSVGFNMYYR